jgi:peptide/nickel transport system ATP-binding protein
LGALLSIENLTIEYVTEYGRVQALQNVDLEVREQEIVGLMGESGCGKSTLALSIVRLLPPPARIVRGKVLFKTQDLLSVDEDTIRKIRGAQISMVFQNPASALNPVMTIGDQIAQIIELHGRLDSGEARKAVTNVLKSVGFPAPEEAWKKYPHELSGGMNQRALIAMAISCNASMILCDEPTSALDVATQAQILSLLLEIKKRSHMSLLLITHNPGLIAETCDRVVVMYAGKVVEIGDAEQVFDNPRHPYTRGLIKSIVSIDKVSDSFETVPGEVVTSRDDRLACRFSPRCPIAREECRNVLPPFKDIAPGHKALCHRALEES